jgi:hypothetical protein
LAEEQASPQPHAELGNLLLELSASCGAVSVNLVQGDSATEAQAQAELDEHGRASVGRRSERGARRAEGQREEEGGGVE